MDTRWFKAYTPPLEALWCDCSYCLGPYAYIGKHTTMRTVAVLFLFTCVLGIFLFYWYEVRSAKIKHECYERTMQKAKEARSAVDIKLVYEFCLHDKGL